MTECHCGDMGPCPMQMVLHAGHCESILLSNWTVTTTIQFSCAATALYALAFLYEALKFLSQDHLRRATGRGVGATAHAASHAHMRASCSSTPLTEFTKKSHWHHLTASTHLIQTFLYTLQIIISYTLMLVVMNFNIWLFVAVVLGLSMGYFTFGWIKRGSLGSTDCCH